MRGEQRAARNTRDKQGRPPRRTRPPGPGSACMSGSTTVSMRTAPRRPSRPTMVSGWKCSCEMYSSSSVSCTACTASDACACRAGGPGGQGWPGQRACALQGPHWRQPQAGSTRAPGASLDPCQLTTMRAMAANVRGRDASNGAASLAPSTPASPTRKIPASRQQRCNGGGGAHVSCAATAAPSQCRRASRGVAHRRRSATGRRRATE